MIHTPRAPRPSPRSSVGVLVLAGLGVLLGQVLAATPARAEDPPPAQQGDTITWVNDVVKAFDQAAAENKPLMVCINSKRVDGGREEPAAKGLREVVYLDPRIVTASRRFVCVFLTSEGSSDDYGELRARFGLSGVFVSPQHIFAHPQHKQGDTFLKRREYWPYGKGEDAVKQLLAMMDEAFAAFEAREGTPATPESGDGATPAPMEGEEGPAAPDGDAERKAWIESLLTIVREGDEARRRRALESLIANDKDGDCIDPVIALVAEFADDKDKVPQLVDVVRVLGLPGKAAAAEAMHDLLKHREDTVRANVAVTLEYIGHPESADPLKARVAREKDEKIANHMYRALGRCGVGDARVRALLLKKAKAGKSEWATYGPIVGLAYQHKDAKAARGVEKLLKQMGPPGGGRRGGGRGTMQRALLAWTLAQIEDPKSGAFMRERLIEPLENTQAWWKDAVVTYYDAVARICEGDAEAAGDVDAGIRRTLEFSGGTQENVMDDARRGRDTSRFEPKAEWDIEGRSFGGGPGGGPGGGRGR